jgi:hypothetical protein
MPNHRSNRFSVAILIAFFASAALSRADDDDQRTPASSPAQPAETRFGLFSLLDSSSKYYSGGFPEPLRVEDTTLDNELRLDFLHQEAKQALGNQVSTEVQKSLGIMTFEIQAPYVSNREADDAGRRQDVGDFGNVELGARIPCCQWVRGPVDNSAGLNFEVDVPTNSRLSKNTEITPGLFDDLCIGRHFTMQTLFSFASLLGSAPEEGRESFEYSLNFAYAIEDEQFALPHVERIVPMFELVGETGLSGHNAGHDSLTATIGGRVELKPIGGLQPELGIGYIFPIDQGGRQEVRWGIISSIVFEF